MGLFKSIKHALGHTVVLDADEKEKLIIKPPLKKDELKLNTEMHIDDGYDLVLSHLDNICDCLAVGKYKFNDSDTPKLYKFVKAKKTKKGLVSPKAIAADLYYINKNKVFTLPIDMPIKFKAIKDGKKIKAKLEGSFDFKVVDSLKFIKAMRMDYAVLRDDKVKAELSSYCGYYLVDILNKFSFSLAEISDCKLEVLDALKEMLAKDFLSMGLEFSNIKITKVMTNNMLAKKEEQMTDTRIDDIFKSTYGSPIDQKETSSTSEQLRQEILANNIKDDREKEASTVETGSIINLGFGGFTPPKKEETPDDVIVNSTVDEYEKASKAFTANNYKQPNNLVLLGGEEKHREPELVQTMSPPKTEPTNDIMLGRGAISPINNDNKVEIEDIEVQKSRKVELQKIKDSLADEIKRPKVIKENKHICKYCSNKLSPKDAFCSKCGKSTSGKVYCKACGEENSDSNIVCKVCGSKL